MMSKCRLFYTVLLAMALNCCSCKHYVSSSPARVANATCDIVYGENSDWEGNEDSLKLDLYAPKNFSKGETYPLVVFIHGGGFLNGDKKSTIIPCSILADSGFIVASVNYRLGWDKGTNLCDGNIQELFDAGYRSVQDVNAALRFLVSKANLYSIDTNWIFLAGSSAGAIAALHAAYLNDSNDISFFSEAKAKFGELNNADNNFKANYSVKGICSVSGALVDSNFISKSKAIPTIFFHGEKDEIVPVDTGHYISCSNYPVIYGSLCLYRRLNATGVPAIAHILPDAGHGKEGESEYSDEFKMSNTACFFHQLMGKNLHASRIFMGNEDGCRD